MRKIVKINSIKLNWKTATELNDMRLNIEVKIGKFNTYVTNHFSKEKQSISKILSFFYLIIEKDV
jgi:hypothetical protein